MNRRVGGLAVGVLILVGACGAPVELAGGTADDLQQRVLAVTEAAAAGQYDVATAELEEVRARLEAGVDEGDVSAARYRVIDDALDVTAAELAAALQAQQAAAEQAAAQQAAAEQDAAEQAAAEQAAAEQAQQDNGSDDEGKGKGTDD